MSKEHSRNLFNTHLANLKTVCPKAGKVFVCPICMKVFHETDINSGRLDTGHVWPQLIRESSEKAKHQHVLLCKTCNSKAGSAGDVKAQRFEEIREEYRVHKYRNRRIRVGYPGGPWVTYKADIEKTSDGNYSIHNTILCDDPNKVGEVHRIGNKKSRAIRISPATEFNWLENKEYHLTQPLVFAGWLTSAYLLAFYELGYRFVFQAYLDPVRDYILALFEKDVDDRLDFDEGKDVCVAMICDDFLEDPLCCLFVPTREGTPDHLEISYLDFLVRLPFRHSFQREIIESIPNEVLVDSDISGLRIVDFDWDMIIDEPDYCVVGSSLVRKDK